MSSGWGNGRSGRIRNRNEDCACVKLFTHLTNGSFQGTFSLLANSYNFLFHCSVISELIELNVFLNSFKSYKIVCTQSKSNQRAHGFFDWQINLHMTNTILSANRSEMFLFGFFQRLVIPVAEQKDRCLWERDCRKGKLACEAYLK